MEIVVLSMIYGGNRDLNSIEDDFGDINTEDYQIYNERGLNILFNNNILSKPDEGEMDILFKYIDDNMSLFR